METIKEIFTATNDNILWWQMSISGIVIFILAIAMIRFGGKRMLGKESAIDIVLAIIIGSILSRGITGNSPFIATVVTTFCLILFHKFLVGISFYNKFFENLVKGKERLLVKDGKPMEENLKKSHISQNDLMEAVRLKGKDSVENVKEGYLERNGQITFIERLKS